MNREKEAGARIKINRLLEDVGWRFEDSEEGKANIKLESDVKFESYGEDFETEHKGYIDFLLLDKDGRPLVVVEAKRSNIEPLSAKEQARNYARNKGARFIILSNGNLHYFWDTMHGNPETISRFPSQDSISQYRQYIPNPAELAAAYVDENYIIDTQLPGYSKDPDFQNDYTRPKYLKEHNLKQLRPYQVDAIKALQAAARQGSQRFLFEMATGTGKTLVSAAIIKLFLKTGNARRVLFLVDRLELEDQAFKSFKQYLGKDFSCVIYKENKDSWQNASIVVSTIQTFLAGDRYKKEFSITDFEFVISDEAHRSIGGNSRAVFEYFVGYKLGLTATPKDYLKGYKDGEENTQREYERRVMLDTYKTFGCASGQPTFRYDLISGVKDGYLINPIIIDARTEITTQLLSEQGLAIHQSNEQGDIVNGVFGKRDYEKRIFNEATNISMCKAFLDNGLLDPTAKQLGIELFGKSIVFCVSQNHAARVANILNKLAQQKWPGQYEESDFAMQVTSYVQGAQQMTINFANNALGGRTTKPEGYDSSKTRVAVTVGMMTTGYDCQDLLNIALLRPVFSPADFIQIKGRGTRKYQFEYIDYDSKETISNPKERFKFFDFFATCEYFEKEFDYDQKIHLPKLVGNSPGPEPIPQPSEGDNKVKDKSEIKGAVDIHLPDQTKSINEIIVGEQGMLADRMAFKRAVESDVVGNIVLKTLWDNGDKEEAEQYTKQNILEKPKFYLTLDKIRKAFNLDRRVSVKEFLEVAFGDKDTFEKKDDLLESEWQKYLELNPVDNEHYEVAKAFFKAYIVDEDLRKIIDERKYAELHFSPTFTFTEFQQLNELQKRIPSYVKDYIQINTFIG